MDNRNIALKLRNAAFSLSPKGDRQEQTPQNTATFLNIFSIKDQNRLVKKSTDVLKYGELTTNLTTQKARESTLITPKKEKLLEISKRVVIRHHANKQERSVKRPENTKVTNLRSEKTLEFKETEPNSNQKPIKTEKEEKKEKYTPTPQNELKLFYYFRYHLHSLLINSGKREKIEELHSSTSLQPILPSIKKNSSSSEVLRILFSFFSRNFRRRKNKARFVIDC